MDQKSDSFVSRSLSVWGGGLPDGRLGLPDCQIRLIDCAEITRSTREAAIAACSGHCEFGGLIIIKTGRNPLKFRELSMYRLSQSIAAASEISNSPSCKPVTQADAMETGCEKYIQTRYFPD